LDIHWGAAQGNLPSRGPFVNAEALGWVNKLARKLTQHLIIEKTARPNSLKTK
tara:strand:- start:685 stop:843 length:159 start_codon:yes stop_codon:yes gene_type:complete